jgi:hypothetical protein
MDETGLQRDMAALGISPGDVPGIIASVNLERLSNNPVRPGEAEVAALFGG